MKIYSPEGTAVWEDAVLDDNCLGKESIELINSKKIK